MLWIFRMPWLVLLFTSLSQSGSHPVVLLMMSHQLSLKWALHKCTYLPWFPLFCSEDWVSKCVRMAGSERTVKHFFVFFSQLCLSGLIGERPANPYPGSLWLPEYQWTHLPSWQPPTPAAKQEDLSGRLLTVTSNISSNLLSVLPCLIMHLSLLLFKHWIGKEPFFKS